MKLRKISKEELNKVLELHKKWLNREEGGKRADLSYTDLIGADLSYSNLRYVNLIGTNLSYANLIGTNLRYADLTDTNLSYSNLIGTNLTGTNLTDANLSYSNLTYANLTGTNLTGTNFKNAKFYITILYKAKGNFIGVENIGSGNDTIHYFYKEDRVICGCFDGTMEQFIEQVKRTYKEEDKHYKEYMIAIDTLRRLAKLEMESEE